MHLDAARESASEIFPASYAEARKTFLREAPAATAYSSSAPSPAGEALFTDVAYFGPDNATKLLVLVSATHGVEGYCGSAAQLLFLKATLPSGLPPQTAVLIVHALNAYGFAWDRRVTAEGVDLNRNFVDFEASLPANPEYEELSEHLIPQDLSAESMERAQAAIADFKARNGDEAYRRARSSGQYTRPGGLFYGGAGPTEARRTLETIIKDFEVAGRDFVLIVDYHTGLGPYGYGELQCEAPSGVDGYERAVRIFGPSVTSPELGTSSAVLIPGCQDALWERILGDRHVYVGLEFGTYPIRESILRDDHWMFMYRPDEVQSERGKEIRRATRDHFYPAASDWQEMVVWRSHQVHRQAIAGLAEAR